MTQSNLDDEIEELQLLRESAISFSKKSLGPSRLRTLRESNLSFDTRIWKQFGGLGWCSLLIPEKYGGLELSLRHMVVILEELGKNLLPEPLVPVSVLSAMVIARGSNEALKAELLPRLSAGNLIAATAWQETQWIGGDQTSYTSRNGSSIRLSGTKRFFRPGSQCDGLIVSAGKNDETLICWIPSNSPSLHLTHEVGADGTPFGVVTFKDLELSNDSIIATGINAALILQDSLDAATIATSAELLGLMQGAFDLTIGYLSTRTQFGKKVGSFQALQHRIVDLYIQIRLSSACVSDASKLYSQSTELGTSTSIASRAKARCSEAALLVTREAVQLHGAIGFTDEHDIGQYLNRSFVLSAWLGNAAEHRRRYASVSDGI